NAARSASRSIPAVGRSSPVAGRRGIAREFGGPREKPRRLPRLRAGDAGAGGGGGRGRRRRARARDPLLGPARGGADDPARLRARARAGDADARVPRVRRRGALAGGRPARADDLRGDPRGLRVRALRRRLARRGGDVGDRRRPPRRGARRGAEDPARRPDVDRRADRGVRRAHRRMALPRVAHGDDGGARPRLPRARRPRRAGARAHGRPALRRVRDLGAGARGGRRGARRRGGGGLARRAGGRGGTGGAPGVRREPAGGDRRGRPGVGLPAMEATVRAACVQAEPAVLDRDATISKLEALVAEAAGAGAELVVFPETFVPVYPSSAWARALAGWAEPGAKEAFALLARESVAVPGPAEARIGAAAREHGVWVVTGVNEVDPERPSTLYNTLLYHGPDGSLVQKHRKLVPTNHERLVWGQGDGGGLRALPTPLGRIGGLVCWENYMPLARFALYESGV